MGDDATGPYAAFDRTVAAGTRGIYERGPLRLLGGGPQRVAAVVESAITAERSRTRYPVTASAWLLMAQRRLLPDRLWDRALGARFPRP